MATVGEAIAASIIAQWNVGTGGTKPDPIKYVVEDPDRMPNVKVADAVFVWLPLRRVYDNDIDVAEKFRNVTYTVRIECHTKTDSARQLEIETEVDRILASGTPITGATKQRVLEINDISNRSYSVGAKFVSEILMEVFTAMEESATAYGGATTAALVTDTLEFTAGGGTINRFHDEDDMASDDDDGLASQQSIKAYVDTHNMIGAANAVWVPCPLEYISAADAALVSSGGRMHNTGNTNFTATHLLSLPPVRGGLDLYVAGTRISLLDADAQAYVNVTRVTGYTDAGGAELDSDPTDKNSAGLHEDVWGAAVDASAYGAVKVQLDCVVDAANELDVQFVTMKCYYA